MKSNNTRYWDILSIGIYSLIQWQDIRRWKKERRVGNL